MHGTYLRVEPRYNFYHPEQARILSLLNSLLNLLSVTGDKQQILRFLMTMITLSDVKRSLVFYVNEDESRSDLNEAQLTAITEHELWRTNLRVDTLSCINTIENRIAEDRHREERRHWRIQLTLNAIVIVASLLSAAVGVADFIKKR